MPTLSTLNVQVPDCSLYVVEREKPLDGVKELIASTSDSRAICNDPHVLGVNYTHKLGQASAKALKGLSAAGIFTGTEHSTSVLTILRGGLNFELRGALAQAFNWNCHGSWFISAQRQIANPVTGEWEIIEDAYKKIYPHGEVDVVFGDVVATGTSLRHGLGKLTEVRQGAIRYRSVTFFTIGAAITGDIISDWKRQIEVAQGGPVACNVLYFEGVFGVASPTTPLRIKLDGTDLVRRGGIHAPEFDESQYESPLYPLERCTIYDAGSRAFHIPEYLEDVIDYWSQVAALARDGVTFEELVTERYPSVDTKRFKAVDLAQLAQSQIAACKAALHG
jgi:hypothetical protein